MSARKHQTHHNKEPKKRHHIGKKSGAVVQQEFFLLVNTKQASRDKKWLQRAFDLMNESDPTLFAQLQNKYQIVGLFPKDFSELKKHEL